MEHLFHVFLPGTPENTALVQMVPVLGPFYLPLHHYLTQAWRRFR